MSKKSRFEKQPMPKPEKEIPRLTSDEKSQNSRDRTMVNSIERKINSAKTKLEKIVPDDAEFSSEEKAKAKRELANLDRAMQVITMAQNYIQDGRPLGKRTSSTIKRMNIHFKHVLSGDLLDSVLAESASSMPTGELPPTEAKYTEGQTATGPGGEKIIYRNGEWVKF